MSNFDRGAVHCTTRPSTSVKYRFWIPMIMGADGRATGSLQHSNVGQTYHAIKKQMSNEYVNYQHKFAIYIWLSVYFGIHGALFDLYDLLYSWRIDLYTFPREGNYPIICMYRKDTCLLNKSRQTDNYFQKVYDILRILSKNRRL